MFSIKVQLLTFARKTPPNSFPAGTNWFPCQPTPCFQVYQLEQCRDPLSKPRIQDRLTLTLSVILSHSRGSLLQQQVLFSQNAEQALDFLGHHAQLLGHLPRHQCIRIQHRIIPFFDIDPC